MITTRTKEITQLINGPVGKLEVSVGEAAGDARKAFGVVCHPHPLYGGTMHNKIVTTLAKTFQGMGVMTVRFNFRGVMESEGCFDQGKGESDDLMAVIEWMRKDRPDHELWLAGFSFGSYVAAKAATQLTVSKLVTVAPPVQHFPMQDLPPITCPWVLVQGERDDVVPPKAVLDWAEARRPQPVIIRFPEAGHYFHGQLGELRTQIQEALQKS